MCRRAVIDLPPAASSAAAARQFLDDTVLRWGLAALRDDLLLAVSELVTNSVIHARTPILVTVSVSDGVVEVGVRDHDSRRPVMRAPRPDLISDLDTLSERLPSFEDDDPRHPSLWVGDAGSVTAGRGLHLLAAVSDEWGVATDGPQGQGKEVWFTHRVPAAWPWTADCHCLDDHEDDLLTTGSGRPVRPIPGPWNGP